MANGDKAAAAGMDVVPGTADRRQGYDEINKTRDYIADRTSAVQPIAKGGTGATTAAAARAALDAQQALGFTPVQQSGGSFQQNNKIRIGWDGFGLRGQVDVTDLGNFVFDPQFTSLVNIVNGKRGINDGQFGGVAIASAGSRNTSLSGSTVSLYADVNGLFGVPGSSRAVKKNLLEWSDDDCEAFLESVHAYHGHYLTDDDTDPMRPFFILEEFIAAGFGQFVIYGQPRAIDHDGNPRVNEVGDPIYDEHADPVGIGLHYELVTVALYAIARRQEIQYRELATRVQRIEHHLNEMEAAHAADD